MKNLEIVKCKILSVIDENGGMARVSTIKNILAGTGSYISNADVDWVIEELLQKNIITQKGNMYYRVR